MSSVTPFNPINISLFQPNEIAGLALWLDAADSSTVIRTGANVTQWNDKSGNSGRDATAFSNPTLSNINGVQAMNMTSGPYFTGAVSITGTTFTCFAVANTTRALPNAGNDQRLVSLANTTNVDYNRTDGSIALFNKGTTSTIATWRLGFSEIASRSIGTNTPFIAVSQYNGTSGFLWQNGTAGSPPTGTASSGSFAITKYGIGNQANPTSEFWQGTIGEVIVFNTSLTTTQRQQIESYLAYKWGLQTLLPTTHPYYNSPYNAVGSFTNINQITRFVYPVLPSEIAGLSLWLDAADSSTLFQNTAGTTPVTNGSQIQLWKDKSSSVNNATNSQTVMTYNSSGLNGLPAISFPGTQTTGFSLSGALLPNGSSDATYFFVIRKANSSLAVYFTHGSLATNLKQFFADNRLYADKFSVPLLNDSVNIVNQNIIVSCSQTSLTNGVNGWRNGTPFTTTAATTTWNVGTTVAWLGSGVNESGPSFIYAGVIAEVIVYARALTTTQRQQIEAYLAYKWGLQANLPVTHPYYNNPITPTITQSIPTAIRMYQYSPRAISGLALWLDAADSSTVLTSGTDVTQWNDKSSNAYICISNANYTLTTLPTYNSNATYRNVNFAPSQVLVTSSNWNYVTSWSCFVVLNTVSLEPRWLISPCCGVGSVMMAMNQGINKIYANAFNSVPADITGNHIEYTSAENTNAVSNLLWYRDAVIQASNVKTLSIASGTTKLGIGGNGTFRDAMGGTYQLYEVLIYNSYLSTPQRQQIEGYLAWKWGLQSSLPASHPYKLYPPS